MEARRMISSALLLLLLSGSAQLGLAQNNTNGTGLLEIFPTDNICAVLSPQEPQASDVCARVYQVMTALFGTTPKLFCYPLAIVETVNVSADGVPIPFPLSDMRPVPVKIPRSMWESEGATYYWMYRTVWNFLFYDPCYLQPNNSVKEPVPQGWDLVHTVIIQETTDGNPDGFDDPDNVFDLPCGSVITRDNMMVIFMRGAISKYEWAVSSTTYFTDTDKIDPRLEGMGRIHEGFSMLALKIFDSLQPVLEEQVVKGRIHHVAVSGHSLGAGFSGILAYLIQQYLNDAIPGLNRVKVDAFLFGTPNAGDKDFNEKLAQKVNIRNLAFSYDVISQMPCAPETKACPGGQTEPFYIPNTEGNPPQLSWDWRTHRGLVLFGPGQMPYQSDKWQCFQHLKLTSTLGFFAATHGCSYACAFSSFVNVTKNVCLLSSEGADLSVASYCPSFPVMFSSSCMPYLTEP
eukprot:gene11317-18618_t